MPRLPAEPVSRRYGLDLGRPIDRVYIEGFLERNAADVQGAVLEVVSNDYTRRFGGDRLTSAHVLDAATEAPRATLRGNLETGEGLPDAAFDCFICTQTLSYTLDVDAALANAARVLKPGGVLLATVPGISQQYAAGVKEREFPDLWRFTSHALRRVLERHFESVTLEAHGTVRSAAAFLYGVPADRLDADALGPPDPDYEVVLCARAVRPG
ncbi:MAG: hypothetical protein QOI98_2207 [Solirubrobacteraceae bacterium]|jgi:SAM-dependent methyltransferase|nr:hypothetical protein [Solirubrobacteraceae bacterium]